MERDAEAREAAERGEGFGSDRDLFEFGEDVPVRHDVRAAPGEFVPPNHRSLVAAETGETGRAPESAEEDRAQLSALGFSVRTI